MVSAKNSVLTAWGWEYSFQHNQKYNISDGFTTEETNQCLPPFAFVTDARLDHIDITEIEVKNILLSLVTHKSTGPDSI